MSAIVVLAQAIFCPYEINFHCYLRQDNASVPFLVYSVMKKNHFLWKKVVLLKYILNDGVISLSIRSLDDPNSVCILRAVPTSVRFFSNS